MKLLKTYGDLRSAPDTLPEKYSALLRLAVADARKSAKRGVTLDMGAWLERSDRAATCTACMAGAVMRESLGVRTPEYCVPGAFQSDLQAKLRAVNHMRTGALDLIVTRPAVNAAMSLIRSDYSNKRDGGRAKWSTYLKAADMLEAAGY